MKVARIMNTTRYIPFYSVSAIILENKDYSDMPFFSGTGFFVNFPLFDEIFFVTAKHCIIGSDGKELGTVKIKYHPNQTDNESVNFHEYILTKEVNAPVEEETEDIAIFIVGRVTDEKQKMLRSRALRLLHQDDIDLIIKKLKETKGSVRTVGFPSVSKDIDYDQGVATIQPRGFHGKITGDGDLKNRYKIEGLNWKDGGLEGFSGSPILELLPSPDGNIVPVPIGVLVTGNVKSAQFLSINVVSNTIANYLMGKYDLSDKEI